MHSQLLPNIIIILLLASLENLIKLHAHLLINFQFMLKKFSGQNVCFSDVLYFDMASMNLTVNLTYYRQVGIRGKISF